MGFYNIDFYTIGIFLTVTTVYAGIAWPAAAKLGSNFDERYKIVTAMAAAFLVIVGGWRFLDERAREVAKGVLATKEAFCSDSWDQPVSLLRITRRN